MRIIALANQKGGVGKTTTVTNLGAALQRTGQSVLLIDLDPQAHLTWSLGVTGGRYSRTMVDLLSGVVPVEETILVRNGIDLVPASMELTSLEQTLADTPGREHLLKGVLQHLENYDYILLDCPPTLGILTLNAFTVARELFIPVQAEYLALRGMRNLLETVKLVQQRLNPQLSLSGIIGTRYDQRKKLNREVIRTIREYFHGRLFRTLIHENIALAEAPSHGQTIFEYRSSSRGARDYAALAQEIIHQNLELQYDKQETRKTG